MKRNHTLRTLSFLLLFALLLSTLISCSGDDTVTTTTTTSATQSSTVSTSGTGVSTRPRPLPPELGPLRPTQSTTPSIITETPPSALSSAYQQELEETVDSYAKIVSENAVNYIFITDLHVGSNDSSVKHQLDAILAIIDRMAQDDDPTNDIDFLVLGGDLTTGMFSNRESYMAAMDRQLAPLRDCSIPVLILRGNHDDNSYWYMHGKIGGVAIKDSMTREEGQAHLDEATFGEEQWYTYMLHNYSNDDNTQAEPTSSRVHDVYNPDSAYYYYDLDAKKTRIVCLDAIDNDLGKATVDKNGSNFWGYSLEQFKWLYEQALTAPEGYNYIFFSHMAYHSATADSKAPHKYEHHSSCRNFGILENILCAFQNKTSYILPGAGSMVKVDGLLTYQEYVCDFTNRTGKILSYQYGHHHADASYTDAKSMIPTMTTGTSGGYTDGGGMKIGGVGDYFSVTERRENGTLTEALFDVVSVSEQKVYQIRFGAGDDNVLDPKVAGQVNTP